MALLHADMHIHLDQFADPTGTARDADEAGCGLFCATTTPTGYLAAHELLSGSPNVRVGAGLHPWWIADGRCGEDDIRALESLIPDERYIGEIGLDFLEKHAPESSWEAQTAAFRRICAAAGAASPADSPKILTIHSVRATQAVLSILEETGCLERCICILHWFGDSVDLLWDAIDAECWFSFGERSLRSGKGREYIKLIPRFRLLFETDMPWPGDEVRGFAAIEESLDRAETKASAIIGEERVGQAAENAAYLLGL